MLSCQYVAVRITCRARHALTLYCGYLPSQWFVSCNDISIVDKYATGHTRAVENDGHQPGKLMGLGELSTL